ncbi:substrate-binding domain-containing protein [Chloroflexi bacterium TSY]|nr:substrate-binding domain-containing protein [Chloroflexi bacterium TSY]
MSQYHPLNRRDMLKALGLLGASTMAAACGPTGAPVPSATTAPAQEQDSAETGDKKYSGVTLRMLTQAGVAYEPAFVAWADEFTAQTGAQVEFEFAPWETLMPKVQADLASGSPQFDLFCNDIEFQYTIWPELEPINDFIDGTGYDMEGFFAPIYNYGEGIAGQAGVRYGLPVITGVSVLFYRTDLIDSFPTTWADYEAMLAANTNGDTHGLSFAGVTAQLVKLFLARYWSQGDPLMTPDWQPLINGEKGVKALTMLKDHMTNYAPPGILAWDNPEAANAFLAGDVAVMEGWGAFILPSLNDPDKSNVVDNWSIAPYPENGTGNVVQHNVVMLKTSQNKEAAFDLMAHLSNPANAKAGALDFGMDPARKTVYTDDDVVAARPYMPKYATVLEAGKPFTPGVPQWLEMFISVGEGASKALSEQATPQEALDEIAAKWVELIEQNPLDFEYAG